MYKSNTDLVLYMYGNEAKVEEIFQSHSYS